MPQTSSESAQPGQTDDDVSVIETDEEDTQETETLLALNLSVLMEDIQYMSDHIASLSLKVAPTVTAEALKLLAEADDPDFYADDSFLERLATNHDHLRTAIAPVTPASLRGHTYARQKNQIIWGMWAATLAFLIGFLILTGSSIINPQLVETSFLYRIGWDQWTVALLYITAAGIGACFYNLVSMYRYILAHRFDVAYKSCYAMRILLGIVAGYVLAEVIPIEAGQFSKPLLAMLGGFSAEAVEAILTRFVETLKATVQGNLGDQIEAQKQAADAKAQVRETQLKIDVAKELSDVLNALPKGEENDDVRIRLQQCLDKKLA